MFGSARKALAFNNGNEGLQFSKFSATHDATFFDSDYVRFSS